MGFWQRAAAAVRSFRGETISASKIIDLLNRGTPLIGLGRDLYSIPEVRTAINFIAEKVGSIPFYQVRSDTEGNSELINDRIQRVLTVRANPYQSPQVFWTYVTTRLLLGNNVFILPEWDDNGTLQALYPLPFTQFQFSEDRESGKLVITFPAAGNYSFFYDDVIHLQRFPTPTGGERRQATGNYTEMVGTMQAQAVKDSANSQRIAALLQVKTQLKGSDMKKKLDEFKELFLTSENTTGFGMIGAEYELHNLDMKINPLNKDLMESIVGYLYNYFGVSREVVTHTASDVQYEQFIDNTIKPIVFQIEEELTYKLFSETEIQHNRKIQAELIDLEISTLTAKTTFFKEMLFGGVMTRNEIRRRLGMPKGPVDLDKFMESKNFQSLAPGNYTVGGGETDGNGN